MYPERYEARLKALLMLIIAETEADRAALFVPRGSGLAILAQVEVDQATIDLAEAGWAHKQRELHAGQIVRYGRCLLWPLFDGPELAAMVFADRAPEAFPDDLSRQNGALLVARLKGMEMPTRVRAVVSAGVSADESLDEVQRDQLALLLRRFHGNVAAVARELGVRRSTVYRRADRHGLDASAFRPRPARA